MLTPEQTELPGVTVVPAPAPVPPAAPATPAVEAPVVPPAAGPALDALPPPPATRGSAKAKSTRAAVEAPASPVPLTAEQRASALVEFGFTSPDEVTELRAYRDQQEAARPDKAVAREKDRLAAELKIASRRVTEAEARATESEARYTAAVDVHREREFKLWLENVTGRIAQAADTLPEAMGDVTRYLDDSFHVTGDGDARKLSFVDGDATLDPLDKEFLPKLALHLRARKPYLCRSGAPAGAGTGFSARGAIPTRLGAQPGGDPRAALLAQIMAPGMAQLQNGNRRPAS